LFKPELAAPASGWGKSLRLWWSAEGSRRRTRLHH